MDKPRYKFTQSYFSCIGEYPIVKKSVSNKMPYPLAAKAGKAIDNLLIEEQIELLVSLYDTLYPDYKDRITFYDDEA